MGDAEARPEGPMNPGVSLGVATVILEPGFDPAPVRVVWSDDGDDMDPELVVGLLRAGAAELCRIHALDGRRCLEDFLQTYPLPSYDTRGPL